MNTAQIVIRKMQSDSSFQVLQFLAKGIGQPCKSSHCHSHSQVLSLDMACTYMLRVRSTIPHLGYNLRNVSWGVPRCAVVLTEVAKQLYELGKVARSAKHIFNSPCVEVKPVCRKLKAFLRETRFQMSVNPRGRFQSM